LFNRFVHLYDGLSLSFSFTFSPLQGGAQNGPVSDLCFFICSRARLSWLVVRRLGLPFAVRQARLRLGIITKPIDCLVLPDLAVYFRVGLKMGLSGLVCIFVLAARLVSLLD